MTNTSKIYIAGHRGMVGSAIERNLKSKGFDNIVTRTSAEVDLRNQNDVQYFLKTKSRICITCDSKKPV